MSLRRLHLDDASMLFVAINRAWATPTFNGVHLRWICKIFPTEFRCIHAYPASQTGSVTGRLGLMAICRIVACEIENGLDVPYCGAEIIRVPETQPRLRAFHRHSR